jgi:uncharacterized repeat protein (TIGR01451 family)
MSNNKYKQIVSPLAIGGLLLVGLFLLLNSPPSPARAAPGDVYCVTPGGGDYPACDQVFTTVQAAVDAATGGEEIRVAAGIYTGVQARPVPDDYSSPPASGLITQVVYISKTVTVRGGYTTPFTDPPDSEANPTTLDAQGQGRVMVIASDITPTVEGLRITGGDATGLSSSLGRGGGVYIIHAAATIRDNRVFSNTADRGGGLYLNQSTATLSGNTVTTNTVSDEGGGLYLSLSDATLSDNTISANTADDCGGGLLLNDSAATLSSNIVATNTASDKGGGLYVAGSDASLRGNTVTFNTADDGGGGLYLQDSAATLDNNFVTDNSLSQPSGLGSGLYVDDSSPRLRHNTVARNQTVGGQGQGLYVTGETSRPQLHNTILVSHSVGISVASGSAHLEGTLWGGGAWANTTDWSGNVTTGTVNVWGDPAFVDPDAADRSGQGDYHIGPGSDAVDAGVYPTLDDDVDGEPRPAAFGPDIGADERPGAGLQTHKWASSAVRSPGGLVTYTLVVTGVGTGPVDAVTLVDRLPPEQRVVTSTASTGVCAPLAAPAWGGGIACTLGTLNVDASAHITLTAQVTTTLPPAFPWPMRNSAWITGTQATGFAFADVHLQDCHVRLNDEPGEWEAVQVAVDASTQPTDVVKVAGYCAGVTSRSGTIQMVRLEKTLTLQGGWNTAFTQRDVVNYPTTLDGLGQGRVLYVTGNIAPTIEGLRITGGDAGNQEGGGAYVINATATIRDNQVYDNIAHDGGGLYLSGSDATLDGNTISGNVAHYGGGLYLWHSDATFSNNTVISNTSGHRGGGLYLYYSAATLSNNTTISNASSYVGGGLYLWDSDATLSNNIIISNIAANDGGGLWLRYGDATLDDNTVSGNVSGDDGGGLYLGRSAATLSGNTIISNTADSGGGLYLDQSDATLDNNTVSSNVASGYGGGLLLVSSAATLDNNTISANAASGYGGGLRLVNSAATLDNNTISANTAERGGGLYLYQSDATLNGNTVSANNARQSGGGMHLWRSDATLTNTIVADNWADDRSSGLYVGDSAPRLLHTTIARNHGDDGSGVCVGDGSTVALINTILVSHTVGIKVATGCTATLESTLWRDNTTDWDGAGTIVTGTHNTWGDPLFGADGYHLLDGSAAIDAGVDAGVTTDIDGEMRPMGLGYDIGADEFLVCAPLGSVSISGPTQGYTDTLYTFTGVVTPPVATPPFTYTWSPEPESGQGAASAAYQWAISGTHTITLTAENCGGGSDVATHAITIRAVAQHNVYLPLILRN